MNVKSLSNCTLFGVLFFATTAMADNSGPRFKCPEDVLTGGSYQIVNAPGLPGKPSYQTGIAQVFGKWSQGKYVDSFSSSSNEYPLITKERRLVVDRMQVAVKLKLSKFHVGINGLLVCEYGSKVDPNHYLVLKEIF